MATCTARESKICLVPLAMGSQLTWVPTHKTLTAAAGLWPLLCSLDVLPMLVPGSQQPSTAGGTGGTATWQGTEHPLLAQGQWTGQALGSPSSEQGMLCHALLGTERFKHFFPSRRGLGCSPLPAMLQGGGQWGPCRPRLKRLSVLCACICLQVALNALQGMEGWVTHGISNFHSVPDEFNLQFGNALSPAACCRGYATSFGFGQLDD